MQCSELFIIMYKTYLASLRYSTWSLVWSWISIEWQCTWCLVDISTSKVATLQSSTILYSTDSVVGCTIHPSDFQCSKIKNHKIIIYVVPVIQNVMDSIVHPSLHCQVRLGARLSSLGGKWTSLSLGQTWLVVHAHTHTEFSAGINSWVQVGAQVSK